jgi:hypothetical protein
MKKQFIKWSAITFFIATLCMSVNAQNVGINSTGAAPDGSAALDVNSANKGFLAPRVALTGSTDITTIASPATSLLIYNTSSAGVSPNNVSPGYYFWDGFKWQAFLTSAQGGYVIGETRSMFISSDFGGWVLLDGRSISALTPTQQVNAIALGFTANIPSASDSYLSQNGAALGTVSGSNSVVLTQANLPNVSFSGVTSTDGDHTHGYENQYTTTNVNGGGSTIVAKLATQLDFTYSDGDHMHNVTVSSGGSNSPVVITPKTMSVNMFVYLGQ